MSTLTPALISGPAVDPLSGMNKTINIVMGMMVRMQVALNGGDTIVQALNAMSIKMEDSETSMVTAFGDMMTAQGLMGGAMSNMYDAPGGVPVPPEPPPVPEWESWKSPQIFQSTGAERFVQELEAVQAKMRDLASAQDALDMSDSSFLPPEAMSDIAALQQRIQNLGELLTQAELKKSQLNANVEPEAFEALNASIEKIRHSIFEAVTTQEELNTAMKSADLSGVQAAYTKMNNIVDHTEVEIRNNTREQAKFNKTIASGQSAAGALLGKITSIAKSYVNLNQIKSFLTDAWSGANDHIRAVGQLQSKMSSHNNLTPEGVALTTGRAKELEASTTISATAGIMGQAQLAEYVQDPSNVAAMTEAMYNLAAGMHGVNVSQDQLMQTADLMGKAMMGDIDALASSGLKIAGVFSEAEKNLLETGTEAERAALVIQMIEENLGGLAEAASQTPEGAVRQFANSWDAVKDKIGNGIMPVIMLLVQTIQGYMPLIETIMLTVFGNIIDIIEGVMQIAMDTANFIVDNWSWIAPMLWGIVAALSAFYIITQVIAIATRIAAIAQAIYSAILKASPFVLIISLIIGLIAVLASLWASNDAFAAGLMRAWNTILNFFDQVPIFFMQIGNGITNIFQDMKVKSLQIMESLINGVIDRINDLIQKLNIIPGVQIKAIGHVSFAAEAAVNAQAIKQAGEAAVAQAKQEAKIKADQREQNVVDAMRKREEERLAKELERNKRFETPSFSGQDKLGTLTMGASESDHKNLGDINKVGEVGKINDTVDISSEDLKTMRELAEMKNIQNFVTLTPQLAFGDTHVRQDGRSVDEIVRNITELMEQEMVSSARGVFNV